MYEIHYTVRWGSGQTKEQRFFFVFQPKTCRGWRPRHPARRVTNKKPSPAGKVARACERRMRRALRENMFAITWFGKLAVPPSTSVHTAPTTLLIPHFVVPLPRWGRLRLDLRNEVARRGLRALQQRMCEIYYTVRLGADRQRNNAFSLFSNPKPVGTDVLGCPFDVQLTKSLPQRGRWRELASDG